MFPILLFYGLVFIFCSLAPPTTSFSHGGSHASCREMIPGHIRAHPLDPQHSHVGLRTSASSYLPGQLITVTVRGSRDFMGFLLQARSVEVTQSSAGRRAGMKSTRLGLLLVGGSWILTPPGTHTLHCFSEGDTVTHSDKQRKRNLTFLWRAPDKPMGDIRFHITVVQSYFVYWAGIESAVVHDGSRRAWRGSNTTVGDGASTVFVFQDDKVTSLQGLIVQRASTKQRTRTDSPATTLRQRTKTSSRTPSPKSLKTFTNVNYPALKSISNTWTLGSQSDTDTTPVSITSLTKETGIGPVSHTNDPKTPMTPTSIFQTVRRTDASATLFPNTTAQFSVSPLSPLNSSVPFFPLSDEETEAKETTINSLEPKPNTNPELKDATLTFKTSTATSTIHGFHSTTAPTTPKQRHLAELENQTRPEELNGAIPTESSMSTIQAKISTHSHTSPSKLAPQSHSDKSEGSLFSQSSLKPQTSPPKPVLPSSSITLKPFLASFPTQGKLQSNNGPSGPKSTPKQINLDSTPQSQSVNGFYRSVTETTSAEDETSTQSSVTPQLANTHFFTLRFDPSLTLGEDLKSQSTIKTTSAAFGFIPSATVEPPPDPSSVLVSMYPSHRSTSLPHSSSSSITSQPQTAPALSALHSPSPISTPPWLSSPKPSSSSLLPSFVTSATSSFNTSSYPSPALFSSVPVSTLPPFDSSKCITNASSSSPSSTVVPPITSSSSVTSTLAPSFFSPTSTSSSSSFTSPDPGPSPAPRRSLHTRPTSSAPSQKTTVGQMLLNPPTQRTVVHPNPKPHPNLRLNHGHELKPKIPSVDTKPSNPAETPSKDGKYPDIIPRHSSWELGMLLGCSAGLGMVLVIGVRYMYRQACGRRTEVTLNDREREYERGDRGLIHVQECGDLVRVRKIRENSFVLLTEYDVLASPGH